MSRFKAWITLKIVLLLLFWGVIRSVTNISYIYFKLGKGKCNWQCFHFKSCLFLISFFFGQIIYVTKYPLTRIIPFTNAQHLKKKLILFNLRIDRCSGVNELQHCQEHFGQSSKWKKQQHSEEIFPCCSYDSCFCPMLFWLLNHPSLPGCGVGFPERVLNRLRIIWLVP